MKHDFDPVRRSNGFYDCTRCKKHISNQSLIMTGVHSFKDIINEECPGEDARKVDCAICDSFAVTPQSQPQVDPEHVRITAAVIVGRLAERNITVRLCKPHRECVLMALNAEMLDVTPSNNSGN